MAQIEIMDKIFNISLKIMNYRVSFCGFTFSLMSIVIFGMVTTVLLSIIFLIFDNS